MSVTFEGRLVVLPDMPVSRLFCMFLQDHNFMLSKSNQQNQVASMLKK